MKTSEIKKSAISKFSNKYKKLVLIQFMFMILTFAFSFIIRLIDGKINSTTLSYVFNIIFIAFYLPFNFGVLSSFMKMSNNEDVPVTEFINIGLKKFLPYWKVNLRVTLRVFIKLLLCLLIAFFIGVAIISKVFQSTPIVHQVIYLVLFIYIGSAILALVFYLPYSLVNFLLFDNPDEPSKEILIKSSELMKGNKLNYLKLCFSFIGWFLLYGFILVALEHILPNDIYIIASYIPTIFLSPYILISQIEFYNVLKNNGVAENSNSQE